MLHPSDVISKVDGDKHFISADMLAKLYGVHPRRCVISSALTKRAKGFIHLYPQSSGNYDLSAVRKAHYDKLNVRQVDASGTENKGKSK